MQSTHRSGPVNADPDKFVCGVLQAEVADLRRADHQSRDTSGRCHRSSTLWPGVDRVKSWLYWKTIDIYLAHHISSHVTAMDGHLWSKPSKVLSLYTGEIQEEDATGRFRGSIAISRQCHAFDQCGGWPSTLRGYFDQQLLAKLTTVGPPANPGFLSQGISD